MKMSEGILTCKDKVNEILADYNETRDSDKLLFLAYLCKYHGLKQKLGPIAYAQLKAIIMDDNTPTMESIRRVRQKLQEDGQFVGKNRRCRLKESIVIRDMIGN